MIEQDRLLELFNKLYSFSNEKIHLFFAPGRVNFIGEHIDYNGGPVMPMGISLGVYLVVRKRTDRQIFLNSTTHDKTLILNLDDSFTYKEEDDWVNYPKGIFQFMRNKGFQIGALDCLVVSDLPVGSGLSSSAAIELVFAYAMMCLFNQENHLALIDLALLCQEVENKFIGVNCGIMDQFAVAMAKRNNAILLKCNTLDYNYITIDLGIYTLVIMNSNKPRSLIQSAFNERINECEASLHLLNKKYNLKHLCEADINTLDSIDHEILKKRVKHVITEKNRVYLIKEKLEQHNLIEVGKLLNQSHDSLKNDYEVSCTELDILVENAQKNPYCIGARMTGAGFGGCAIALVEKNHIYDFNENIANIYYEKCHIKADFYICEISDGVRELSD